jgi:hypothetical protein
MLCAVKPMDIIHIYILFVHLYDIVAKIERIVLSRVQTTALWSEK